MEGHSSLYSAVVGNNGYAGATGCEPLSDFAQVSDHGFLLLACLDLPLTTETSSLPAKN